MIIILELLDASYLGIPTDNKIAEVHRCYDRRDMADILNSIADDNGIDIDDLPDRVEIIEDGSIMLVSDYMD